MAKATKETRSTELSFEVGSGNVYADLGYVDPEEMAAKAELVRAISGAIAHRGISQTKAAEVMGVDQPTLSKLLRGRVRNFTLDRLSNMLRALGRSVVLYIVEPEGDGQERGHLTVKSADDPNAASA